MPTTRSKLIYGRIYQRLLDRGFKFEHFASEQIYDEMQVAQDEIISEVGLEKKIEVTLEDGTEAYALAQSGKEVVNNIKAIITPDDWEYELEFKTKEEWNEIIKDEYDSTQPTKAVIIENELNLYPVPDSDYDGDKLYLICNLKSSISSISESTEPELPSIFDKEIEWLTLYYLTGDESYYNRYLESVNKKLNLANSSGNGTIIKDTDW